MLAQVNHLSSYFTAQLLRCVFKKLAAPCGVGREHDQNKFLSKKVQSIQKTTPCAINYVTFRAKSREPEKLDFHTNTHTLVVDKMHQQVKFCFYCRRQRRKKIGAKIFFLFPKFQSSTNVEIYVQKRKTQKPVFIRQKCFSVRSY